MKAFKGFTKDLTCRDFQYEIGKTYETESAELCEAGFHACENPLDVLNYYDLADSRFAEVDLEATEEKRDDDTKRCGKKIHIKAELSLKDFIKAGIDFLFEDNKAEKEGGYSSQLAASGYLSQLAASGYLSQLAASGDYSKLAASGDYSKLAASGDSSQLAASGDYSKLAASGDYSVVMCAGHESSASASKDSWITLAEWKYFPEKGRWLPVCVKTEKVDGEKIRANVFYQLKNGEFVECEDE